MKIITTVSLFTLLTITVCNAQYEALSISKDTGLITCEKVLTFDSLKADKLFDKTKVWFIESFKSSKEVITGEGKPIIISGQFTDKYSLGGGSLALFTFRHQISMKFKDGAVKLIIDQVENSENGYRAEQYWKKSDGTLRENGMQQKGLKQLNGNCVSLSQSLQNYIMKKDSW